MKAALIVGKIRLMAYWRGLPFSSVSFGSDLIALKQTPYEPRSWVKTCKYGVLTSADFASDKVLALEFFKFTHNLGQQGLLGFKFVSGGNFCLHLAN